VTVRDRNVFADALVQLAQTAGREDGYLARAGHPPLAEADRTWERDLFDVKVALAAVQDAPDHLEAEPLLLAAYVLVSAAARRLRAAEAAAHTGGDE
jgi:hypothetical protein